MNTPRQLSNVMNSIQPTPEYINVVIEVMSFQLYDQTTTQTLPQATTSHVLPSFLLHAIRLYV